MLLYFKHYNLLKKLFKINKKLILSNIVSAKLNVLHKISSAKLKTELYLFVLLESSAPYERYMMMTYELCSPIPVQAPQILNTNFKER